MPDNQTYSIARDGNTIGQFTLAQVREGLKTGQLKISDHYWTQGMGDWATLSVLAKKISDADTAAAQEKIKAQQQQEAARVEAEAAAKAERTEARTKDAATKLVARATLATAWECLSCKMSFTKPVEPKSGYDTIRRAIVLGASAFGSLLAGSILAYILSEMDLRIPAGFVALAAIIAFLVLLFMFFFEFISSAVHHGIFRAGALRRCPCCSSNLIRNVG